MKLTAKEEAFCKVKGILPDCFGGKEQRSKMTNEEKSLIKQIYVSYSELLGAYGDKLRFHDNFYTKFLSEFGEEPIPFKYNPTQLDFSVSLVDILKQISNQIQYFQQEAFGEMKSHMDILSEGRLFSWVMKLKNNAPSDKSVLLLKVCGTNLTAMSNLNAQIFGKGIKDLKENPSTNVCNVNLGNNTIWLGFIPELQTPEQIKQILKGFYGSPKNTDVTWI